MMGDRMSPFDALFADPGFDPGEAARSSMRPELPKRFWTTVALSEQDGYFAVLIDGRTAKTPGRHVLGSRTKAVGEVLASEWSRVEDRIDPLMMPMTRLVNVALDAVETDRAKLLAEFRAFAGSDLICYRADRPQGLVDRQNTVWNPYLDRLKTHHNLQMRLASGIMPLAQDEALLDALSDLASERAPDMERLVALSLATTLTGSAILALALTEPGVSDGRAQTIWQAAHVDEDWNRAQWGEDAEASALRAGRWRDFEAASLVLFAPRD